MSCRRYRHPVPSINMAAAAVKSRREALVIVHLADMMRMHALQEARRFDQMKFRIAGFDAKIEAVRRSVHEPSDIEHRMVRLWHAVQRQHAEHRAERREEDRHLEGDGNESR